MGADPLHKGCRSVRNGLGTYASASRWTKLEVAEGDHRNSGGIRQSSTGGHRRGEMQFRPFGSSGLLFARPADESPLKGHSFSVAQGGVVWLGNRS